VVELKDAILARVDIVELIGQYVSLRQAGREYKGRCPFHEETAASFHVNPEKGVYHCFGCKAGGNVINFVMSIENLEWADAMQWLASKYRIEVPRGSGQHHAPGTKERLFELNEAALKFFRQSLKKPEGEAARKYLSKRGIGERLAADFDLGYAPREWRALADLLLAKGAKAGELMQLGLIKQRKGDSPVEGGEGRGHYDAFRHRLIFPIHNVAGRVIGFAGRALSDEDSPKYLNVTNTPLYDKSGVLYNLNRARSVLRDEGAVVVEGYMDVIGLSSAGVDNAVASCGTALTEQHVRLLTRYTDRFFLAFDGDEAGARAAWSAGALFLRAGHDARVVALPEGVDPDDLARSRGREAWLGLLGEATSVVRFWLDHQHAGRPDADLTEQRRWVAQLAPLYRGVPDVLVKQQLAREVASALRLGAAEVSALLEGQLGPSYGQAVRIRRNWRQQRGYDQRTLNAPELYPREGEIVEQLLTEQELDKARRRGAARQSGMLRGALAVEREVTRRLLVEDDFRYIYLVMADVEPVAEWFADPQMRAIFERLRGGSAPEELIHAEEYMALCAELVNSEPLLDSQEQLLTRQRNEYYRRQEADVSTELRKAIRDSDEPRQAELFREIMRIKGEIRPLEGLAAEPGG
jgi:DNA primase